MKKSICFGLVACLVGSTCIAAAADVSRHEKNRAMVELIYKLDLEAARLDPAKLVLPGLVADRNTKRVVVKAEALILTQPPEFFLVAENSGHDYEAVAIAFAKPSDIHKALEFIGIQPGHPYSSQTLNFWPKGERVIMSYSSDASSKTGRTIRAERIFKDDRTEKTLPEMGFVFVGSTMVDSLDSPGTRAYAADVRGPNSIASSYNEPQTVLDLPRLLPQGAVYSHLSLLPEYDFPTNSLIDVILEAEYKDGKKRVVDLDMEVKPRAGTTGDLPGDVVLSLKSKDKDFATEPTLKGVLEAASTLVDAGHDPFVTIHFDDALPLKSIHELCKVFESVDTEKGMRIEAPPAGRLYYKAFVPDPSYLDRESRVAQPWELRLALKDGKIDANLTRIEQLWRDDRARPDLSVTEHPIAGPEAFKETLQKLGPGIPVILVIADPAITQGQLMSYISPVFASYPQVHVFLKEQEKTAVEPKKAE